MKKLFFFIQALFVYPFLAVAAFANTPTPAPVSIDPCKVDSAGAVQAVGIVGTLCKLGGNNIATTIQGIIVLLIVLAVVIALLWLLYGGIKWIMSKGDKTEVEAARNHIVAAVTGLIVVFLSIFIISIVLAAFNIQFEDLKIPKIGGN